MEQLKFYSSRVHTVYLMLNLTSNKGRLPSYIWITIGTRITCRSLLQAQSKPVHLGWYLAEWENMYISRLAHHVTCSWLISMTPLKPEGWSSGMAFLTENRSFQFDPGYRLSVWRLVLKAWLLVLLQLNLRRVFRLEERSTLRLNGRAIIRLIEDILIQVGSQNVQKYFTNSSKKFLKIEIKTKTFINP